MRLRKNANFVDRRSRQRKSCRILPLLFCLAIYVAAVALYSTSAILHPTSPTIEGSSTITSDTIEGDNPGPTFLWGIPTIDHPQEKIRRQMVRDTYLSFYKNDPSNENRICTLQSLLAKTIDRTKCQIAYTFFMGANSNGPTELVYPNASFPITIDPSAMDDHRSNTEDEDDIVYLNIKENMEDGKMQTWFKYASLLEEQSTHFDYIAKVDSDVLLFPPAFLDYAKDTLPRSPDNAASFGGMPLYSNNCNPNVPDVHPCPLPLVGSLYMSGELYFMSPDLAAFISSPDCDRSAVSIPHEDIAISNFVFSNPSPVKAFEVTGDRILRSITPWWSRGYRNGLSRRVHEPYRGLLWAHSVSENGGYFKDLSNYESVWNEFISYWPCQTAAAASSCWTVPRRWL